MSDAGLNASIYEQLREYADQLDKALANVRSQEQSTVDAARQELVAMLRDLSQGESLNPTARLVAIILKHELPGSAGHHTGFLSTLAHALESRAPTQTDIAHLEQIALAIDREWSNTGARMRGRL